MASRPLVWEFTAKDIVMVVGFISTILFHYYAIKEEITTNKIQTEASLQVINFRLSNLENGKNKTTYYYPKEAILPQSTRIKREFSIINE